MQQKAASELAVHSYASAFWLGAVSTCIKRFYVLSVPKMLPELIININKEALINY